MSRSERVLLTLIGAALRDTAAEPGDGADGTDWERVHAEARAQAVAALAGHGLPASVPDEQRARWQEDGNVQTVHYVRYLHAQDELLRVLAGASIPTAILKGAAAAVYYPRPSLRAMGDIDCIVPRESFELARQTLIGAGYARSEGHDGKRHVGFQKDGVEVELHRRFSYEDLDIEDYITEGLRHLEQGSIDGHSFPMLPRLANGLVLLAHMRSHLRSGLGLRQVIDWMMYVERELDDEFWDRAFSAAAEEKGLRTLAVVTARVCQKYLGLSESITWCKSADDALCEALLDSLLSSGNFGRKNGRGQRVEMVATSIRRKGLFRYLQEAGECNWQAYHRHEWLKPFAWFYQIFRYARQGFSLGRGRQQLENDLGRSRERYEMLKKLNIV